MTGMTSRGIGSTKLRHDYVSLSDILYDSLEELGHEVTRGRVPVGTDLDDYDAALVLVYWVSSLSTHYSHETALALAELGSRAVLYVDDWRAQTLGGDLAYHVRSDEGWARHTTRFRKALYEDLTDDQVATARGALLEILNPDTPWELLVPQHAWGDMERFRTVDPEGDRVGTRLVGIDPTPMVPLYPIEWPSDEDRARRWVLATVQEHDRWRDGLATEWPVLQLGGVKKRGGGVNPGSLATQAHVSESVVVQAYADNWGLLVPPYASAGSGWWRPRYTFGADARSIVFAPPEDATRIGDYFRKLRHPNDIAGWTDAQLRKLADGQAEQQRAMSGTKDQLMDTLERSLERARRA